jgi:DNA ligase D-like protein (predicted 3'-phosphoesterase)
MSRRRLPRFVVQLHDATTLHFDFRLEIGGVLRSWAVPKGPSLDPGERRLAVEVADHELGHADFEGVVAGAARGSGAVIIWDEGTFDLVRERPGHMVVELSGRKLTGGFALTRTGPDQWILVKMADGSARRGSDIVAERPESVRSGRTWQELTS